MSIKDRLALVLTSCVFAGLIAAGVFSFQTETSQAEDEVIHTAELLLQAATAIREYTVQQVTPIILSMPHDTFISQTVPSYAALATLKLFQEKFPNYQYREPTLNPTNTNDRANAWEVSVIQEFRRDPELEQLSGEINNRKDRMYVARPIKVGVSDCLQCHSTPDKAPRSMIDRYGSTNGFGWELGEVVGAQIVEVPTDIAEEKALRSFLLTIGALTSIVVLGGSIFLILYRVYIADPLRHITEKTEAISLDKKIEIDSKPPIGGQFSRLEESINRLKTSIDFASDLIEKNVDKKDR